MNLYAHKDANIRKTWFLLAGFFAIVIGFGWILDVYYGNPAILVIAVVLSLATSVMSYWYSDKVALGMASAQPIARKQAPELYDIVENLSITAGLPAPKIYLINDAAPNAFATGRNPEHAAIAVTTGLMARLNRTELEGVIAHELSHIGNWDMLVSTIVVVLVGIISIAGNFFMRSMWLAPSLSSGGGTRRNDDRERGGNALFAILAIAGAILLPIAATVIQLAISRKREFLADASGALLTRYPEGLARALEKISADPHAMTSASPSTAHLWFESPFKADTGRHNEVPWHVKLFMTHPPVAERIKALRG